MPNSAFNPTRLSGQILRQLRMSLVTDNIVNRNWQGEIEGPEDTVEILTLEGLTVRDYADDGTITVETEPGASPRQLAMEIQPYFAFIADVTDNASAVAELFAQEGLQDLRKEAQKYVLGKYTEADADNQVTFDEEGGDDIEEKIADAGENLDDNEVPDEGRFIVLRPHEVRLIEDKISDRGTALGDQAVRAGYQGTFRGFEVYKAPSSHFTNTGTSPSYDHCVYGSRIATTYADAIVQVRRQPSEKHFGDQIDGLLVAGAKVVRPEALGDFRVKVA